MTKIVLLCAAGMSTSALVRKMKDAAKAEGYLIYNDPLGYADLILNGDPEGYLKNVTGYHGLED